MIVRYDESTQVDQIEKTPWEGKTMRSLSIARKLQAMVACAIAALLLVGGAGFYGVTSISKALSYTQKNTMPSLETIGAAGTIFVKYRLGILQHIQNDNISKTPDLDKMIAEIDKALSEKLDFYEKNLASDDQDKAMAAKEKQLLADYRTAAEKGLEMSRSPDKNLGTTQTLFMLTNLEIAPIGAELESVLEKHIQYNEQLAATQEQQSEATARIAKTLSAAIALISIAAVATIGFFLIRGINGALRNMEQVITQIEGNLDFTLRVDAHKKDELGKMAGLLNRLIEKLQTNLKSIAQSTREVTVASAQMAETSQQVAQSSEQQSAAASDMAATVEEMTVSINHVADRATEANSLSAESGQLATSGEEVISQTVRDIKEIADTVSTAAERIRELEAQGGKISAVVAVIKEVADQTNLLALNAAIEAARAGEQGRGFAVVADEVRKLAERTAASTQEIATTINTMQSTASYAVQGMQEAVEKVAKGVARASDANNSIQQIGAGSRETVRMVGEITTAIREQGAATTNIAVQVEKIAQMAEQSSAASAESARAAQELDQLAETMRTIVANYRL